MASSLQTFAAAACSWIDPATDLPEYDEDPITHPRVAGPFFTGNKGYRFCNFTQIWFDLNDGRIGECGFTEASGIYRAPSFARLPSHAFATLTARFDEADAVRFTQVCGARTVSPEVIGTGGGIVGGAVLGAGIGSVVPGVGTAIGAGVGAIVFGITGEIIAHRVTNFPPIWSKIQIRLFRDGRRQAQLLQHSLFPSLTFYVQDNSPGGAPDFASTAFHMTDIDAGKPYYNATKSIQLPQWHLHGWGRQTDTSDLGPCYGNPWGISESATGGMTALPNP